MSSSLPNNKLAKSDFGFPDVEKKVVLYLLIIYIAIIGILSVIGFVIYHFTSKMTKEELEFEKNEENFNFPTDLGTIINHHMLLINIENLLEIITADPEADPGIDFDNVDNMKNE